MTDFSSTSSPRGARIAAFVFLGLLGFFALVQGSSSPSAPAGQAVPSTTSVPVVEPENPESGTPFFTPPPADVAALLNGLSLGNELEGWKVVSFNVMKEKIVWIELGNNGVYFSVGIAAKGQNSTPPPVQTELYDLSYGMTRPKGTNIVPDVYSKVTELIAARIRQREKEVAKPTVL